MSGKVLDRMLALKVGYQSSQQGKNGTGMAVISISAKDLDDSFSFGFEEKESKEEIVEVDDPYDRLPKWEPIGLRRDHFDVAPDWEGYFGRLHRRCRLGRKGPRPPQKQKYKEHRRMRRAVSYPRRAGWRTEE